MILFKKDTKGNIRYLDAYVVGAKLFQESGILDTENPVTHEKTCKGKNIGRSNETTPAEQALKELDSLVTEKLQEGYFKTKKEAETEETLFPMLAKDYKKESKKIDWKSGSVYIQPKLDGMRCLLIAAKGAIALKSRDGRYIKTMQHIEKDLEDITPGIYDGELYAHGFSFQENMEFVKKWRDGDDGSVQVKFHCYDVVTPGSFKQRLLVRDINLAGKKTVEFVKTDKISSEKELRKLHAINLDNGYEGSIVRHGDAEYKINGRSSNLLKFKDFIDIACPIVDITPADQRPEWGVPVLSLGDGRTFRAGMKYTHEGRVDFLKNKAKYIGKTAEIRFFEYSDTGIPRFPVMVGIRLDK